MLYEFLGQYKDEIIQLCRNKVSADNESKPSSELLEEGLPLFYNELIGVLSRTAAAPNAKTYVGETHSNNRIKVGPAGEHGKESLRLGYNISQVVHSYGAICQSVTEFAQTKSYKVTSREFQDLNLSLDCAIAEAVTEFEKGSVKKDPNGDGEIKLSRALLQEIKNSLAAATIAYQMVRNGRVGTAGNTSERVSKSLEHVSQLIEKLR